MCNARLIEDHAGKSGTGVRMSGTVTTPYLTTNLIIA